MARSSSSSIVANKGMGRAVLLLIVMAGVGASVAAVRGHPGDGTPAARFWAEALPGTPMPAAIADLVQRGTDRSPLAEHRSAATYLASACLGYTYNIVCGKPPPAAGAEAAAVEGLFFRESEMRVGSTMTVSLPPVKPAAFLPRDVAEKIPFGNLTYALAAFGIAPGSGEAARVRDTLRGCRAPPLAGERKACATSLEGVVRSATRMLATTGRRAAVVEAAASALPSAGLPRRQYAVQAVSSLGGGGERYVACHGRPYPYAVYECHMTGRSSKAYVVSIRGAADPAIAMAALCHFDTSNWNPAHPAFEALRTQPGGSPVCHFLPYADLLFGEKAAAGA